MRVETSVYAQVHHSGAKQRQAFRSQHSAFSHQAVCFRQPITRFSRFGNIVETLGRVDKDH